MLNSICSATATACRTLIDIPSGPVGEVDRIVMKKEGEVMDTRFIQQNPSSSSVDIWCLDLIQSSITPIHDASWTTNKHTGLDRIKVQIYMIIEHFPLNTAYVKITLWKCVLEQWKVTINSQCCRCIIWLVTSEVDRQGVWPGKNTGNDSFSSWIIHWWAVNTWTCLTPVCPVQHSIQTHDYRQLSYFFHPLKITHCMFPAWRYVQQCDYHILSVSL